MSKFIQYVRRKFPTKFILVSAFDVSRTKHKSMFWWSNYTEIGFNSGEGKPHNVMRKHPNSADTIISLGYIDHDNFWKATLKAMYQALNQGGLLVITATGKNYTSPNGIAINYQEVSTEMLSSVLSPSMFSTYFIRQKNNELQFYGIKATSNGQGSVRKKGSAVLSETQRDDLFSTSGPIEEGRRTSRIGEEPNEKQPPEVISNTEN